MCRVALIVLSCLAVAAPALAGTKAKKLIEYGWDVPNAKLVREAVAEMERIPFDGLVIRVEDPDPQGLHRDLGWRVFSRERFKPEDYEQTIRDLKATRFKKLKENFIQVISYPGDVDWFDPDWSAAAHNAACLARVAKQSGCKGIMFDPEEYGGYPIWTYRAMPESFKTAHTYEEYAAKARERGREFIQAINKEFPDITILALFGPSITYLNAYRKPIQESQYSLLEPFYDGVCEAATSGSRLVDGYEFSYGFRTREKFIEGRRLLFEASKISANPTAFKKHVRAGFGVWADNQSLQLGWHPDDFSKNYFTPAGLRATLNYALEQSDKYVWVYSERLRWWDGKPPQEFVDALRLAKEGPGLGEPHPMLLRPMPGVTAPTDEEVFAEFRKTMTEILDLPRADWRFARDPDKSGAVNGWHRVDFDDSGWKTISIGKFWEEQGEEYDGRAWYRVRFTAPTIEPGRQVFIVFGAVDESAWVWLNGDLIGSHDLGEPGWNQPFALDVTKAIKAGQDNALAINVLDRTQLGGIWRPVKLMVK